MYRGALRAQYWEFISASSDELTPSVCQRGHAVGDARGDALGYYNP